MKENPDNIDWNTFPIDNNKRKRTSFEQYLSSKTTTTTTTGGEEEKNNSINSLIDHQNERVDSVETKYRKIKDVLSMITKSIN